MMAPISRFPSGLSRRTSFSSTGTTNARVLPEPVTACSKEVSEQLPRHAARAHLDDGILVLHEQRDGRSLYWCHLLESHVTNHVGAAKSAKQRRVSPVFAMRLRYSRAASIYDGAARTVLPSSRLSPNSHPRREGRVEATPCSSEGRRSRQAVHRLSDHVQYRAKRELLVGFGRRRICSEQSAGERLAFSRSSFEMKLLSCRGLAAGLHTRRERICGTRTTCEEPATLCRRLLPKARSSAPLFHMFRGPKRTSGTARRPQKALCMT